MANESPAGARRRVRLALREAREAADLTQGQVAEAMEWSLSKVMRIESGEVTISPNDLRPLMALVAITDPGTCEKLVQDSRASRRRQLWWDEPRFREHLTPPMRQLIQYETEATQVRHFCTMIIPGRLQTPAYARATLTSYHGEISDSDIEGRIESRMRRREELLARKDRPEIFLLIDESVLRRKVGSSQITGEQLTDLVRLAREMRLSIRLLPFSMDAPWPTFGPFEILNLPGDGDNAVMYRESDVADEIVEDTAKVVRHRHIFERLWNAALDQVESIERIAGSAKSALDSGAVVPAGGPTIAGRGARRRDSAR